MPIYRESLPQLDGSLYITDAGLETDLIFNKGIEIREFAAHTLLPDPEGRKALQDYFRGFIALARECDAGLVLDSVTWKAHRHWSDDLGEDAAFLAEANRQSIELMSRLREEADMTRPIVLNAVIGPRGDAYRPEAKISAEDAERYYAEQLGWLAETEVDMVTGLTFTQVGEAIGLVRAAQEKGLPVVISFTLETDGRLPDGTTLRDAIETVDAQTGNGPAYFMINCAHPDHFDAVLDGSDWTRRIHGLRANASRRSHAELDECPDLDAGNPHELGQQYAALHDRMPWLNVFGACCGGDLRHVTSIAKAVTAQPA